MRGLLVSALVLTAGCDFIQSDTERWNEAGLQAVRAAIGGGSRAHFRSVQFYDGAGPLTCGEVKAKPEEPYQRFVAFGSDEPILEIAFDRDNTEVEFDEIWAASCFNTNDR
jgi:hypothetical protein